MLCNTSHTQLQIQMPRAVFIDGQAVLCAKGIKMRNDGSFCDHRCLQFAHVSSWSTYICSISECRICVNFARHPQSLNQKIELSIEPICSPGLWPRFFFSGPHVYTAVPVMKFSRHFWCDRIWRCKEMLCLQRLETLKDIQKPQSKIEICYIMLHTILHCTVLYYVFSYAFILGFVSNAQIQVTRLTRYDMVRRDD